MKKGILFIPLLTLTMLTFAQGNLMEKQSLKNDALALSPPMGWNSWNKFACDIDESMIREIADAMVESGLRDAGYVYLNLDDCWHGERDSLGFIQPDPDRFPSGMKALSDYVHSKGLKFGIYSDAGWETCGGKPGSRGYEFQDALTYANWGVDYLKYDWCNTDGLKAEGAYKTIAAAIKNAGRPVVLSICEWGHDEPWEWGPQVGHLWRTTGDIYNCFDCIEDHGDWKSWGVLQILDKQDGLRKYAGPGQWNDPDMLEVGNGMPAHQDRSHFSMWSMLASPLIAGNDIRNMSNETLEILTNKEVIAVNQDKLGVQAFKYGQRDEVDIWFKPLENDEWAVCFLNRSKSPKEISFNWKSEDVKDEIFDYAPLFADTKYQLLNLWTNQKIGNTDKTLKTTVPAQDVVMLRLSK